MKKLALALAAAAALTAGSYGAAKAEVKIATVGPITGQYAAFGEQMKRGLEMAVKDLNAAGGVNGEKVVGIAEDDACDPKQAVAAANKLVGEGVKFVDGHFCSGSSIPASAVYAEEDILMISPASTNPAFTEEAAKKGWTNVARVCGRDDAQGVVAGNYLADHYKDGEIAILQDKTAYGKGLADETKKQLNKRGVKEGMYEAYTAGEKDYSALVSKMKSAGIKAIYVGGYHTEAGLIIRQAKEQGYDPQLVSGDALVTDEFWKITGDAGQGTIMTFAPDPRKFASAKKIVEKFRAEGYEPEGYTLYTYAAAQVWAEAAKRAKSFDTEKLAKQIHGGTFDTVIGTITLDDKGDIKDPKYVWYIWKNGTYGEM
ncbi:amino acid/amide ABC transporter substrate-binding protein, HAAT family [Tistlia consotensis]|uniref:Amino acid/amide ABC transporter substrate-binding protein, HAAT family n=1 Tax=Tistlia consotensis USBA 355 TaxID=560819 RepID=A0A1Y6BP65_9PROT|nr:branched-chain amino acid ABC transporter substrate-binding protein [Tistlia consotensis]SMF21359.1 amino acid/amide ABC transporter substrate-binding protein, HAAT family [Tistlia consotensis USBA 355]SNR47002.1 amino acid/amide ABC transporter substrate-binding protein, HAAT family [Tistlia consotensis]